MLRAFTVRLFVVWVASAGAACLAADGFWSLQLENDLFGSGKDRFYSHGTEVSYLRPGAPPRWLGNFARRLPFFDMGDTQAVQFSLGQQIFTPEDTQATELLKDDRPYAGWLFGNAELLSRYAISDDHEIGNLLGVTLGVVGPAALGEPIQNGWHDLIGVKRSRGWDNQLRNEIGINLNYTRRWRYFDAAPLATEFETAPHVSLSLGNVYTYAAAGVMLRWGRGLRNDYSPPNIRPGFPGLPYIRSSNRPGWYLFGGVESRAVVRNLFLDGNSFVDSHSVDKKPLVADLQFGLAYQFSNTRVALSNVWRTSEFKGQPEKTRFGGINLSFAMFD